MESIKISIQQNNKPLVSSLLKILMKVQKQLVIFIPVSMLLGLVIGYFFNATALKSIVLPATFLMVYPMMVTLNIKRLFTGGLKLLSITQLINFSIIPIIGYLIGLVFFPDAIMLRIGFLLITLIPTSGMTITWTGIAHGNVNEAIRMTVSGLLLGAILTPVYLKTLLGAVVELPFWGISKQIFLVVFVPLILGFATQKILIKKHGVKEFNENVKKKFPPFSTLGVLVIVFIAMALKAKGILENPIMLIKLIFPLILLYVLIFILSTFIGRLFFNKADSIAMVYGTAMRNLSIALAIAMSVFKTNGSEVVLVIALAFIIQVQSAVWYLKITSKVLKNE